MAKEKRRYMIFKVDRQIYDGTRVVVTKYNKQDDEIYFTSAQSAGRALSNVKFREREKGNILKDGECYGPGYERKTIWEAEEV